MIHVKSSLWVKPSYCLFAHETIRNISINTTLFVKKTLQIVGAQAIFWYFYNKIPVGSLPQTWFGDVTVLSDVF